MKKRLLSLLFALVMVFGLVAACGTEADDPLEDVPAPPADTGTPDDTPPQFNSRTPNNTFVVGTPAMNGDFVDGWGNSSYDLSIKVLTAGHVGTYQITPEGQIVLNETVVTNLETETDAAGNKTYTFSINPNLKWNNGEPLTAADYVAGILAYASPELRATGGSSSTGDGLVGYAAFNRPPQIGEEQALDEDGNPAVDEDGEPIMEPIFGEASPYFEGVQLIDEYTFAVTIDAEELPYFWETSFVSFGPVYMAGWFPGNELISDENGTRFANSIADDMERIANTERFAPTVTAGPYRFVSFDGSTVNLERNEHFYGCYEGLQPFFDYIIQREVPDATSFEMVLNGDIDFEQGVIVGAEIEAGKSSPYVEMTSYLRAGFGHLTFALDFGPTQDVNVRFAIAHMIDRSIIIDHVLGGYGATVDGSFGFAQWTYQARRREIADQLMPLSFNLERANELLDETEWVFEADGTTPFDSSKAQPDGSYLRHNADGEVLRVVASSGSEDIGGAIESSAMASAPMIGMEFIVEAIDFPTLLDHYYFGKTWPDEERNWHAFQLAVNFTPIDDKFWSTHSSMADEWQNANGIRDDELDRIVVAMRQLDPTQTEEHADLWLEYQVRWQQILPAFPLYSNEYFDAFNSIVTQVPTSPYANWQDVIMHIAKHQP